MGDMAFALFRFLGQDMAFESMFPLDVSGARNPESLLGAGVGLHFWHSLYSLKFNVQRYFFFPGPRSIIIFFPSCIGICSIFPTSSSS